MYNFYNYSLKNKEKDVKPKKYIYQDKKLDHGRVFCPRSVFEQP